MPADLNAVTSLITAERVKRLMVELARVPSPLTEKLEAEPQLRAFIDIVPALPLNGAGKVDRGIVAAKLAAAYGGAKV